MRMLLAAILVTMATAAQAQQRDFELMKRYMQVSGAAVERWRIPASGKQSCQVSLDGLTLMVRLIWEPGHPSPSMVLSRRDWQFPAGGIETPVMVVFDDKVVRDGPRGPREIMMTGRGDSLIYRWRGNLAEYLEGVQQMRFIFPEGIAYEQTVRVPAVRLVLIGLRDCLLELPEGS